MDDDQATAAPQGSESKAVTTKPGNTEDAVQFLEPARHNVARALTSIVQDIAILPQWKFVGNVFTQMGKGLQAIRGPHALSSATNLALDTLPSSVSPSFWSHSLSGDDILLPPLSSSGSRSFDEFLDGRDLDAVTKPWKERPSWIKEPAERTLALAEEVAENAVEGWSGFIRPVDKVWEMSSGFGPRWGRQHNGVDLAAPTGEPVLASDSGEVTFAGWESGYGNLVEITHRDGWKTLYAHNSEVFTWEGQFVRRGQCIASVGETGRATGPHLHWEIRNNSGKPVDPCDHVEL